MEEKILKAYKSKNYITLEKLLNENPELVETRAYNEYTLLHDAAHCGNLEMTKLILKYNPKLNFNYVCTCMSYGYMHHNIDDDDRYDLQEEGKGTCILNDEEQKCLDLIISHGFKGKWDHGW